MKQVLERLENYIRNTNRTPVNVTTEGDFKTLLSLFQFWFGEARRGNDRLFAFCKLLDVMLLLLLLLLLLSFVWSFVCFVFLPLFSSSSAF